MLPRWCVIRTKLPNYARTHEGLAHPENEDSYDIFDLDHGDLCLLVCDGMGGMGRGQEASALAIKGLREALRGSSGPPGERLDHALIHADTLIRHELHIPGQTTPGATGVVVLVQEGAATVGWVGDSRVYLIRDGAVIDRTKDHKLVNELVAAGELTEDEARTSTLAHVITRALGGRPPGKGRLRPEHFTKPWLLQPGDQVLLCSDGLCDLVEDHELPPLLEGTLEEATQRLIDIALERGGHDNITVILARWEGEAVTAPPQRAEQSVLSTATPTVEYQLPVAGDTLRPMPAPPLTEQSAAPAFQLEALIPVLVGALLLIAGLLCAWALLG